LPAAMISALAATGYASSTPKWVKAAIAAPANSYDKSVSYIVLLDEQATTVGKSGSAETRFRYVVKLLSREGRSAARREVYYDQETSLGKMRAWHLRPDGKTVKLESDQIENQSPPDELYSDSKTKLMHFPDVDAGSVVAFEWVQRARPFINQEYHYFQERSPVVVSRYRLKLPSGWRVEPFFFNHSPINPVIEGNTYTWELHALDPIKDEPLMPEMTSVAPYVAVSYFPSHGRVARKSFSSWQDVSKWASQLMDRQAEPGQAIEAKAHALTADTTSTMEKIEVVSSWVQKEIRYVSIQLGAKGGYRPHPPTLVFKKGYGDCKDKAGLLQAMLRSLGVSSYPVLVYSGDPTRVRPEFPSVLQFNHAILAIATSTGSNTEGETNRVGDLVFFDPTENLTLFGDLPYYLQGSYGLVVKGDSGELVQLPEAPAAANALRRDVTMTVDKNGGIVAEVREVLSGQMAAIARRRAASAEPRDFASEMAALVARSVPGSSVSQLDADDDYPKASLAVGIGVKSQGFANVSGKLMIIPPALFWAGPSPDFAASERQQPVVFDMRWTQEESVTITVPEGERVDEIPSNTNLDASFGRFSQTYKIEGKQITVERRLAVTNRIVGASGYGQLKRFFDAARSASDASLVLVKSEAVASRQ
jgi:transglutaminase-like putative cysteine protease